MQKIGKRGIAAILMLAMLISLAACAGNTGTDKKEEGTGTTSSDEKKIVVKIAHASSENATTQVVCEAFKEKAEELLGKERIEVEIYPNATLGTEAEMVEALQMGTLDAGTFGRHSAIDSRLEVLNLPFLFANDSHAENVLRGEDGTEIRGLLYDIMLENQIVTLGWYETGFREITSNKKIESIGDLKGLLIRTPSTNTLIKAFQSWGASPTAVDLAELYTALQSKVVDAQENPYQLIDTNALYEVQDYLCETNHLTIPNQLVFSEKVWEQYSEDVQKALEEAGAYACDVGGKYNLDQNQKLAETLAEKLEVTHMDEASIEEMKEIAQDKVWPEFVSEDDETGKLVKLIQDLEK